MDRNRQDGSSSRVDSPLERLGVYLLKSTALAAFLLGRASVDENKARKTMANVANRERMEEAMSIYDNGLIMYGI